MRQRVAIKRDGFGAVFPEALRRIGDAALPDIL